MMNSTGRYWTIRWESDPPPAPPHAGIWLVIERTIAGWLPIAGLPNPEPEPYSDPPTGRAYRWPHYPNAYAAFAALRRRHGPIRAVHLHIDPRTGRPRASWLVL